MSSLSYRAKDAFQQLGTESFIVRCALRWACRKSRLRFEGRHVDVIQGRSVIRLANHHLSYVPDMSRSFDHYFGQVEPLTVGDSLMVDYSRPHLHRYRASGLEFEFSSLAEEIDALDDYFHLYTPRPGDTVFDLGAYCGASAHRLASLVGRDGKVVAFEPDPLNFELLQRNIARHGLSNNIVAVAAAVADHTGTAEFFSEGALGSTMTCHSTRGSASAKVTVPTLTFMDACERYGVPKFAKVDIEGAEVAMLTSASAFLQKHGIHFALDTNHRVDGAFTASAVEALFRSIGYVAESSDAGGFLTTWASPHPEASHS